MQLRTAGPRIPANDLELPQHPGLLQSPRQSLLQSKGSKGRGRGRGKGGKLREVEEGEEPTEAEESQEPEVEQEGGN